MVQLWKLRMKIWEHCVIVIPLLGFFCLLLCWLVMPIGDKSQIYFGTISMSIAFQNCYYSSDVIIRAPIFHMSSDLLATHPE